jgi:3-hydroxyisobutyrate dehydrogenase
VWLDESGGLAAAERGAVLVECSTVSIEWIREFEAAAQARAAGLAVLDAPVTGSRPHAAAGELTFLVGGPAEALAKARPALEAMGRAVLPVGPTGSGARLKLINNFLCGVQVAAFAEALVMIERGGLDRREALGVLTGGAPGSPLVRAMAERMSATSLVEPQFHLALMAKDLAYARAEAAAAGLELRTAGAALERFAAAVAAGLGSRDLSAVVECLRGEFSPRQESPNFTP